MKVNILSLQRVIWWTRRGEGITAGAVAKWSSQGNSWWWGIFGHGDAGWDCQLLIWQEYRRDTWKRSGRKKCWGRKWCREIPEQGWSGVGYNDWTSIGIHSCCQSYCRCCEETQCNQQKNICCLISGWFELVILSELHLPKGIFALTRQL